MPGLGITLTTKRWLLTRCDVLLEIAIEAGARDALEGLDVAGARAGDDIVRQAQAPEPSCPSRTPRASRARTACRNDACGPPGAVGRGIPESARVRRQDLVDEQQLAARLVDPELELRVGQDDAGPLGAVAREARTTRSAQVADPRGHGRADEGHGAGVVDVLVVRSELRPWSRA